MLPAPRIGLDALAQLCHRMAISTKAGVDDRKTWRDEASRASGSMQRALSRIADAVAAGTSAGEAMRGTGGFFPPLFCRMVELGEQTGREELTYRRLAEHYDRTRAARRDFLSRITWPLMQLGIAVFVVGLLIWIMGFLEVDLLGFGLTGNGGLFVYVNVLLVVLIALLLVIEGARRGAGWLKPLQRAATGLPVVGDALKTLSIARFTWALQLVLDTPMDVRKALPLALDSSGSEHLSKHGPAVADRIQRGMSVPLALAQTGVLPGDLLDALAVGDEAGSLVETLEHQSAEYQRRAAAALALLAQLAGYLVWLVVAGLLIFMIFRIFSFYTATLNSLL